VGAGTWEEQTTFDFECSSHWFANDKIRFMYKMPMEEGGFKGKFLNTNPDSSKAYKISRLSITDE